jgi:hypothetical protein
MIKCLDHGFRLTESEEDTAGDESVQSFQNDKCDSAIIEVENGNGEVKSECNDTNISDESERDDDVCNDEASSGSSSNGKGVDKEEKQEKNSILELLSNARRSRISGPRTQPCMSLGSKKIHGQSSVNKCNLPSSKYALHLAACISRRTVSQPKKMLILSYAHSRYGSDHIYLVE